MVQVQELPLALFLGLESLFINPVDTVLCLLGARVFFLQCLTLLRERIQEKPGFYQAWAWSSGFLVIPNAL